MTIHRYLFSLPRLISEFAFRVRSDVVSQSPPMRHRAEVTDDVWNAFSVIGHGGPIAKADPPYVKHRSR